MVKWFDYINQQRIGDPAAGEKVLIQRETDEGVEIGKKVEVIYIGEHGVASIVGTINSTVVTPYPRDRVFPVDYSSNNPITAFGFMVSPIRPATGEFIAVYTNANGIQARKYRWNINEGLQVLDEEDQKWIATKDLIDIKDLNAIYIITDGNGYAK